MKKCSSEMHQFELADPVDDFQLCCKLEAISNSNPKGNLLFSSGGKLHD